MLKNNKKVSSSKVTSWVRKLKPRFILTIILFVLLVILCFTWLVHNNQKNVEYQKNAEYQKSIREQVRITRTEKVNDVVQGFGKENDKNTKELQVASSANWDRAKLDKVYFNLIYADKVGSFNDVYAMLSFIDIAEKSGLNIDDNSYGVDQKTRNDIKLRADKIVELRKKGSLRL